MGILRASGCHWDSTSRHGSDPRSPENVRAKTATPLPVFDRSQIERYVLRRVFELGWTTERFGSFDRTWNFDLVGQFATKESIGRKYQWIAYREVLALIADHFQYREFPAETSARVTGM